MTKQTAYLLSLALFILSLAAPATAGIPIVDRDDWSGTYFQGRKLGFNHASIRVRPEGIQVNTHMYFRLQAGGATQVTTISQDTRLGPDLKLRSFTLLQEIMGNRQKVEARVEDGRLKMDISTRGYQREKSVAFDDDLVPASTVWLNMMRRGIKVGDRGSYRLFVEPFQTVAKMDYEVLRRETLTHAGGSEETLVVLQQYAGMETTLWVREDGTILRERSAQGFESLLEPEAMARDLGGEAMPVSSFITLSLVKPQKSIDDPGSRKSLKIKISKVRGPDSVPQDHRQKILKTESQGKDYALTLMVRREPERLARPSRFPITGENPSYLEDSSQIQSAHATIQKIARNLSKGLGDPWKVALEINHWVYVNLEKELVDSFTALDALQNGKGECQSHTNLFTAIARAAGIPTRVVNGLVYSQEYKGFLYHAWPEVYVGEWRALDPTLGQDAVDATHIKLSEGNYDGALKLMEFIGQVDIELLEN